MPKISALPAASALTGSEVFPIVQGGATKKLAISEIISADLPFIDVRSYGADATGVSDASTAFSDAVADLPSTGGRIVGRGTFRLNNPVTIAKDRVFFDFDPGTTINIHSSTYGFHWAGTSAASPGAYGGLRGARLLAGSTSPTAAIYVSSFLFMAFERLYGYGFYTVAGGGSRAFLKAEYMFGSQFIGNDVRWCDIGYNIGSNDPVTTAYRSTSLSWQGGKVGRCARGILLRDVYGFELNAEFLAENCSLGLHITGDKSGANQTNCANGDVRSYFEGNGKHILIDSNGSARTRGISIENAQLETLDTEYDDTDAMESFGAGDPGDYKVELSGDRCQLNGNYWSTAAAEADLIINSDSTDTAIGRQQRDPAAVVDNGSNTFYEDQATVTTLPALDTTPSMAGVHTAVSGISAWQADHVYGVGAYVTNDSYKVYVCTTGGTSAGSGGPTGTGTGITDGTVVWNYAAASPAVSITLLDDMYDGQEVAIRALDGYTTFVHDATDAGLRLYGQQNITLEAGQVITFRQYGSDVIVQTGLSRPTAQTHTLSNVATNRTLDANTISAADLADFVGTLVNDLKTNRVI